MAHRGPIIPVVRRLEDVFHCRDRRRAVSLQECLDKFADANAFELRHNACFKCPVGRQLRCDFSEGVFEGE